MKEQVLKLLNDRKFCDELLEIESESEVKEHFKKNGAEITDEELSEIKEFITAMEKELKKLDNNILKEISGGVGEDEGNGGSPKAVSAAAGQQKFTVEQANQWLDFFGRLLNLGKDPAKFFVNSYSSAKKDECNGAVALEKERQAGENARCRMKMDTIMGLAITAAIAGGIYANRRRICKWIFGE